MYALLIVDRLIHLLKDKFSANAGAARFQAGNPYWPKREETPGGRKELWWRDLEQTLGLLQPRFSFLSGAEGRPFLLPILRPLIGNFRMLNELERSRTQSGPIPAMLQALYYWYAKEGRRPLERWSPKMRFANVYEYFNALVPYLFEQHPVPPVVARLWWYYPEAQLPFAPGQEPFGHPAEALQLYFYLTKGGGLRTAPYLRWELGRSAVRYFYSAPREFSIREAYWYAIFLSEGVLWPPVHAVPWEATLRVAPSGYAHTAFWRELIRLWTGNTETQRVRGNEVGRVIRRLEWLKFGIPHEEFVNRPELASHFGAEPGFELGGHSWASLLRYLGEDVFYQRIFPIPEGMSPKYTLAGADGQTYQVLHIGNEHALIEEGLSLAHCAGDESYRIRAESGESVFWSLRQKLPNGRFKRLLTIEMNGPEMVAVAGLANREATPVEMELLQTWLAAQRPLSIEGK